MGEQRIQGNQNVQIQGAVRSLIEITYNETRGTVPLEPAQVPVAARLPSPARLVRAHSGVVPYVDRGGLLTDLESWVDTPAPFSGHVVGGRGGAGKTRLAVMLCEELADSGWLCGFLSRAGSEMLDALVQVPTARLVVIDYAEARPEQVELLLPLLQANATAEEPVRVLLLVRTGPAQTTNWAERLGNRVDALDALLDECEVRFLEDTPMDVDDRSKLFDVAAAAFAERLDLSPATAAPPDLGDEVFESPLMVVIAAYLAAHGEQAPASREQLLEEVLAHEQRYWREGSADLGADEVLLERMVALATLVTADDEATAAQLLRLLPDLADAPAERRNVLARWVHEQYPGPRWWNPLEPDLVGEHLVSRCFTGQAEVLRGALAGTDPGAVTRPLELLARAAADHPDLANALTPILSDALPGLCRIAVTEAESVADSDLLYGNSVTAAAAIDAAISVIPLGYGEVREGLVQLPSRSDLVLNDLAVTLTMRDVEARRLFAEADPATHEPELATSLNNLSVRLANAGRREEALPVGAEAVEIWRRLAEADPATPEPELAVALNTYSNRLSDAGRNDEALAAIEEAVRIRRRLAEADPDTYEPELAMALNNLSNRLSDADRNDEALPMGEEAVEIWRRFSTTHGMQLAMALNNLSNRLAQAGRYDEALEAIKEPVEVWRRLAATDPAAGTHSYAIAQINLSVRLADTRRYDEALEVIEEAIETWRLLAAANPAAHWRDLTTALRNRALYLEAVGRDGDAAAVRRELEQLEG